MTKALTITPKIPAKTYSSAAAQTAKTAPGVTNYLSANKQTSKATRGIVGTVIDIFKVLAQKISKPENAVFKISKGNNIPSHIDPAAIVLKTTQG